MNRKLVYLSLFILFSIRVFSQPKELTLFDVVLNQQLKPQNLNQLNWMDGEDTYYYVSDDRESLIMGKVNEPEFLAVRLVQLNEKLPRHTDKLQQFPSITRAANREIFFFHDDQYWKFDLKNSQLERLNKFPDGALNIELSPNGKIAFTKNYNLFVSGNNDSEINQITFDGNKDLIYGEAVHRREFGISKGLFWSPDQKKIAFYRMDQSMVSEYPLVDYKKIPAEVNLIKYPMAGQKSHQVQIGIYSLEEDRLIYLNTGEPRDRYLTNITWSPDSKFIYVAEVNRDQDEMQLKRYDILNGSLDQVLFTETSPYYVEPEHDLIFLPDQPNQFLWFSERNGFNQLFLYDILGNLINQATPEAADVTEFLGFGESSRYIYYQSTSKDPLERHLYSTDLKRGKSTRLTDQKGVHEGKLSSEGKYLINEFSNLETPKTTRILNTRKGREEKILLQAENPLTRYSLGEIEINSLQADDGSMLFTRMIKPVNFDPNHKYPVILYVYGGPHVQLIRREWQAGAPLFLQYLAQKGFIVYTVDNRGSVDRGLKFEQSVYRNLGVNELKDQLTGIEHLKSLPYVDQTRMGAYGWSYGGFITISLMLKHPDIFKAAVAGGPVIDWKLYEVMYTERYMDTPQQNPEGYRNANLLNFVNRLKGKLLVIHGLQDDVVLPQHTQLFLRKAVEEDILVDFFNYPTHPHNVRGKDRVHLLNKISSYFVEHLCN